MRASVIVVSYNSLRYLPACLSSICSELEASDELIVVDNGSSDGSAEFVATRYPRARLIRARNTGYAGGNNMGAAAAGGEMLVFLNPDIILRPGALPALLAPLSEPGNIALTTACLVHMGRPEVINTCGNTMHYTGLTYCRGAGQPRAHYQSSTEVDAVSGAAFAIRRTVFERLGGFDERFFMYVEDSDLSWRARLAGYRCLYVPGAIVEHAYVPAYSPTKAFYLDRNRHLMLLKNLSRMSYARLLPGLLLAEAVTWGFLLLKGPRYWSVKLRVYRWLWTHRRTIRTGWESRASRQRDREIAAGMAYRLEFGQLTNPYLARAAALFFHPILWLAHLLFAGLRVRSAPLPGRL